MSDGGASVEVEPTEPRGARRPPWRWLVVLFFVAVGSYAPILRAGFVWDDRAAFSAGLGELRTLGDFFSPPKSEGRTEYAGRHFYPLTELTLKFDQQLGSAGLDASVSPLDPRRARLPHATTLLFHALATLLVALFVRGLLGGREQRDTAALAAAALFAVHPIHTESVCFIVGRTDVLAAIFMLGAILLAWRYRDGAGLWAGVAAAASFGLALLSKELAATLLVLLPLLYGVGSQAPQRRSGSLLAGLFGAVFVGYLMLRTAPGGSFSLALSVGPEELPMRLLATLAFYVGKVFLPVHANPYPLTFPGALQTALVVSLAVLALAAAVVLRRRGDRIPLLGILFFLVTIAPAFLVAVTSDISRTPLAERYLYVPSVGLAMVVGDGVAWLLERRASWRQPVLAGIALLVVAGAAASISRTRIWETNLGFWQFVLRDPAATRQATPWYNLASAYEAAGQIEKAQDAFRHARRAGGGAGFSADAMAESVFADAIAAFRRGDFGVAEERAAQAEAMLEEAHRGESAATAPYTDLARYGFLRAQAHRRATGQVDRVTLERVLGHLEAELAVDPTNAVARRLLGPTRRALAAGQAEGGPPEAP